MAAAGSHPTPIRHSRAREAREHARKSAAEHLQQASAEIDKTCQETTAGVRRGPDTALERMRDVSGELRRRAEHQTAERQDAREQTSDKARRQMSPPRHPRAAHAQRARGLSDEIPKQTTQAGPPAPKATVPTLTAGRRRAGPSPCCLRACDGSVASKLVGHARRHGHRRLVDRG